MVAFELNCANCGMPKVAWRENGGEGYRKDGMMYCCRGCGEGTGCTCEPERVEARNADPQSDLDRMAWESPVGPSQGVRRGRR